MILLIRSLVVPVSIVLALASLLAPIVRASADEDEVYSAPAVRSADEVYSVPTVRVPSGALSLPQRALNLDDLPASASPQARAARPAPILDRVARALVIDLGPLPDLSPPAEEDTDSKVPQGHRIGIHRPLPREFRGQPRAASRLDGRRGRPTQHRDHLQRRRRSLIARRRAGDVAARRIGPDTRWRRPAAGPCLHDSGLPGQRIAPCAIVVAQCRGKHAHRTDHASIQRCRRSAVHRDERRTPVRIRSAAVASVRTRTMP